MPDQSLDDVLRHAGDPVALLRNSQIGPYAFPVVPPEFTNWRDEQRAWRESCVLFDQSHHMTDLVVEGPDALRLLSDLGINSFASFPVDRAKQFVACNHDGYVIGDAILFHLEADRFSLVGRPPAANWVQFNLETGGYDARATRDERSAVSRGRRASFRYQVQGPAALELMHRVTGQVPPTIRFFAMGAFTIAGHQVRALRHGMVGQPGWELFGPWEHGDAVRDAILEAGRDLGLRRVGSRAYPTSCLESGWIPSPLPAVYSGDAMQAYRRWLTSRSYEATASLGGSFVSGDISDYYLTPHELGYGTLIRFDHDFVGRAALERMGPPRRRKVTLVWHDVDFARAFEAMARPGEAPKYIDLPLANYATLPYDRVVSRGETVGLSTYTGFLWSERAMVSLAMLDEAHATPGTEVSVVWGEENGGTRKPTVERHTQVEIRATVAPVPLSATARESYRPS